MMLRKTIEEILCCPLCRSPLREEPSGLSCSTCAARFPVVDGRPDFVGGDRRVDSADARFQQETMAGTSLLAKTFRLGSRFINSDYTPVDQLKRTLKEAAPSDRIVELGSGSRRLLEGIITVDLFPFANVDILADITRLPLKADSVDLVILDKVLEHVPEPWLVVEQVHRILKPGGKTVCICPFIFPYHGYPGHYWNFTKDGLEHLFRDFSACDVSMNIGPTAALTNLFSEYLAVGLTRGKSVGYVFLKGMFLVPVFLLKYLDWFWARSTAAHRLASTLCVIATR